MGLSGEANQPTSQVGATAGSLADAGDQVKEQVRVLGEDAAELARRTKSAMGQGLETVVENAGELYEKGRDKAVAYRDQAADVAREHPFRSIMIAAGVGCVLGFVLGRR